MVGSAQSGRELNRKNDFLVLLGTAIGFWAPFRRSQEARNA